MRGDFFLKFYFPHSNSYIEYTWALFVSRGFHLSKGPSNEDRTRGIYASSDPARSSTVNKTILTSEKKWRYSREEDRTAVSK